MENPLVSVVIATHNREKSIGRAVKSALQQSYSNIEIIVIDDGSTDATKNAIESYLKSGKVHYIYQENQGVVEARNKAINFARGEYIAILDSDDFWCDKEKIEKQVEFLQKNLDHVLVAGGAIKIDEKGKEIVSYILPETDEEIRKKILTINVIVNVTALFRKEAWQKVGGYSSQFYALEDWELWLKMGNMGKFHNLPLFFATYSGHQSRNPSYVEEKHSRTKRFKLLCKISKKYSHYYPGHIKSLFYYTLSYIYSFLPLRHKLETLVWRLRTIILRKPYKIF